MQAQATSISRTQQIFESIADNGPISIGELAAKFNITYQAMINYVNRLFNRGLVKKVYSDIHSIRIVAVVSKRQATFQEARKTVYGSAIKQQPTPVKKAQFAPVSMKRNYKQEIFNYIADNATPSLNPTEVHDAFPELQYQAVSHAMWIMSKSGYLHNDDGQYSLAINKADAVFGKMGRPVGSFKNVIKVNGQEIKIKGKEAARLYKQLQKHYG
jgi:DNA-binding Lrp family transcriptional regulator